jgi:hypothetical protein
VVEKTGQPTHQAYSIIRRDGRNEHWVKIGLVFPHHDGGGFDVALQSYPRDGKIVCREIGAEPRVAQCTTDTMKQTVRARTD